VDSAFVITKRIVGLSEGVVDAGGKWKIHPVIKKNAQTEGLMADFRRLAVETRLRT
jgi:hypothetical protein